MARELPAILGGTPLLDGRVPRWPVWGDEERVAVAEVLESGDWWQGDGRVAARFAADFAAMHGARYGLGLTNGTHTLEAGLIACGIGDGDEVIVPGMTFVASASAVMAVNATPVLVDVDPHSLCIDPHAAEAGITPRTRAVVAVHIAGAACDLDALTQLCDRHGIALIEDC